MSSVDAAIIERVRAARERQGLSQEELGQRLGLSKAGYGHYERGRQPFSVEQLHQLSRTLGISVAYLLGLDHSMAPDEDELLTRYRHLDQAAKDAVIGLARTLDRA